MKTQYDYAKFLDALMLEKEKKCKDAIRIYLELAKQDYVPSMNKLGFIYEANKEVQANYDIAAYWYFRAGKFGDAMAIYNLANFFKSGKGVKKDKEKAKKLFDLAKKKGYKE